MKKIAIIGGGISGISAAWFLHKEYDVTLFEKHTSLGGHTCTAIIDIENKPIATDVGFIVFNDKTYPNFIALLEEWQVAFDKSEMSFSVSAKGGFEYNGGSLKGLFSYRKNLINRAFWKMLLDIIKFNFHAKRALKNPQKLALMTVKEFTAKLNLSPMFYQYYLYPMASAIWSGGLHTIENFSAYFLICFYQNHGLLNLFKRPQWFYIKNGSESYIKKFLSLFTGKVLCNMPIKAVLRADNSVQVRTESGDTHQFDAVIFACHADQVLNILQDPYPEEKVALAQFPYLKNKVVLHSDITLMPHYKSSWASWNYLLYPQSQNRPSLSYYMNKLQNLPTQKPIIVTVNPPEAVKPEWLYATYDFSHPQFSLGSFQAQQQFDKINGQDNIYYCGAYWGYGFHEDGVKSALDTVKAINRHLRNNGTS